MDNVTGEVKLYRKPVAILQGEGSASVNITPTPLTSSKRLPQSCSEEQASHPLHQARLCKLHIPDLQSCASQLQPGKIIKSHLLPR